MKKAEYPMTQYVINIGTIPNDGTGDPLRTAFNETNLNFDQVFAAGPVLSNVQIANNTILTTNTNGNLVLAPNGIGVVQSNVSIVPNTSNIRNLGAADRRWSTVYVQYVNVSSGLSVANLTATGDVTVGGNLSVTGNVINIGNIITDAKTIQLANTAGTANAADGSGITVGANDNIATMLYSSVANAWSFNIGVDTPSIVVNNISADDSTFVTIQDGLDVQGDITAETVSATGNVTSGNIVVNGVYSGNVFNAFGIYSEFGAFTGKNGRGIDAIVAGVQGGTFLGTDVIIQNTGNSNAYTQFNFQNINSGTQASTDYVITANNGNDTTRFLNIGLTNSGWDGTQNNSLGNLLGANDGYFYVQDGNLAIGAKENGNAFVWKFDNTGNVTATGNLIPSANLTYSLGNSTNWWSNVWVAGNTIYIGGVPIGMAAGNVLTVNGNAVLSNDSNTTISTTGNITADYFFGNGSQLTGLATSSISNGTSNVDVPTANGNINITSAGTETWTFDTTGNLTLPANGNINGADGEVVRFQSVEEGVVRSGMILNPGDGLTRLESWDSEDNQNFTTSNWSSATYVTGGAGGEIAFVDAPNIINFVNNIETSRIFLQVNGGTPMPYDGYSSGGNNITFYTTVAPEDSPETVTDFVIYYSTRSRIEMDYDEGELNITARNLDITIDGDQDVDIQSSDRIRIENSSTVNGITISTDVTNSFRTWTFDVAGNLNLPQGGVVHETNIPYGGFSGKTIALVPQGGTSADQQLMVYPTAGADANHLHLTTGNLYNTELFLGNDDLYVKLANTGNIVINSNDDVGNTAQWTFGTDGVLTVPGEGVIQSIDDTVTLVSFNTTTGNANSVYLGSSGGLGFFDQAIGGNWLEIFRNGAEPEIRTTVGNINIQTANGNTVYNWTFDNTGNLTAPGNISTTADVSGDVGFFNDVVVNNASTNALLYTNSNREIYDTAFAYDSGNDVISGTGAITTTGNITGGNISTGGLISATGNIAGGNISTGGLISATGNIAGGNISTTGNVLANNMSLSGNIAGNISFTGTDITINNSPGGQEGGELKWALPAPANTVLSTGFTQDVFQNGMRFFETGGNTRGLYMDLGNAPNGTSTAVGYRDIPQVLFTGNATIATTDAGKHYYSTLSTGNVLTIANNASQGFQVGAAITIVNQGSGNIIIAQGSGVTLYLAGNSTAGNRTVATFGMATIMKVATDTWFINGTGVS
jgi:hypothetical protein